MSRPREDPMVNKAAIYAAAMALYVSAATLSGLAQTSFAALGGKVTDEQGGLLPGVSVTARQLDTNTTRTGVTDTNGQYYLPSLPAGRYELTIELAGFATAKREVVLRVGQDATLDVSLKVGTVEESVLVSGVSALVETSKGSVGFSVVRLTKTSCSSSVGLKISRTTRPRCSPFPTTGQSRRAGGDPLAEYDPRAAAEGGLERQRSEPLVAAARRVQT